MTVLAARPRFIAGTEPESNALFSKVLAGSVVPPALRVTSYGVGMEQVTETGDLPVAGWLPKAVTGAEAWQVD